MTNKINCVLLVDDDGTANFSNERIVRKLNITDRIEMAMNGEKALNFIQFFAETNDNNCPELILLDLKMPVLDGFEFLEYFFRKDFKNKDDIKLFILTSSVNERDIAILKKYPNIGYLEKPLTEEILNAVVSLKTKKTN